jgi:hypothetical protein
MLEATCARSCPKPPKVEVGAGTDAAAVGLLLVFS